MRWGGDRFIDREAPSAVAGRDVHHEQPRRVTSNEMPCRRKDATEGPDNVSR